MDTPLSLDTPLDVERLQIEGWRRMSPAAKAGLTGAAYELALAGVRSRHPAALPREQFLRVAIITLGPTLASAAYPDAAAFISQP